MEVYLLLFLFNNKSMIIDQVVTHRDGLVKPSISFCMHPHAVRVLNLDGKLAQE